MKPVYLANGTASLVDDEDYDLAMQYRWYINNHGYAIAAHPQGERPVYLHRLVMNAPSGITVDHINRNPLDNRRTNLRFANVQQQQQNTGLRSHNTSGYKGVSRNRARWGVCIKVNKVRLWLGTYDTKLEAAHVYDEAALKYFGEFARINFPIEVTV